MLAKLLDACADRMGHADSQDEFLHSLRVICHLDRFQRVNEYSTHLCQALAKGVSSRDIIHCLAVIICDSVRHLLLLATRFLLKLLDNVRSEHLVWAGHQQSKED